MKAHGLALVTVLLATPALGAAQFWTVDAATVQKVDNKVAELPILKGPACSAHDITEFGRYYGGFTDASGRRMIVGQLRLLKDWGRSLRPNGPPAAEAGVHIVQAPIGI